MQSKNRVAFNTLVMYAKSFITIGFSLYSTRLVLNLLGVDDYGAFNLIYGIVAMLAFFSTTVSVSIQRYMSNAIGMHDQQRLADIYRVGIQFSFLLSLFVVILIETLAFFFFDYLNILPERIFASKMVLHCFVLSTFISVISIPYEAAIVAHEDLFVISLIYILDAFLKFGVAIFLIYVHYDKLITYGILIALIYIIATLIKRIYCKRQYKETRIKGKQSKQLFGEIVRFSSWTSLESLSAIFVIQWVAVMLNLFGGTVANAAYGIANQINGQMLFFSVTLLTAINPQIMKSEGGGDRERTIRLSLFACKISFFLLAFFSIPLIIEMPYVLDLWLKNVPENTVLFCRIILCSTLISQLTYGLQSGIQAVGKIRNYQITLFWIKIAVSLLIFVLLKNGLPVYLAVVTFVVTEVMSMIIRMKFAGNIMNINVTVFFINILVRLVGSFFIIYSICAGFSFFIPEGFIRLIITSIASIVSSLLLLKWVIMTSQEYRQIQDVLFAFIAKMKTLVSKAET
jgi:O-antigen/teichoic acid export membrane protein